MNPVNQLGTQAEYSWEGRSVCDVFSDIAKKNPDKLFLQNTNENISYGDLLHHVDLAAKAISALKLDKDSPVAIYLPPGKYWSIAALAILKAGHFYVPLDPDFPKDRNARILQNANVSKVVGLAGKNVFEEPFIEIESLLDPSQKFASEQDAVEIRPESKACIIYTSGSTGVPKGVIQTHQSILLGAWRRGVLQEISAEDRMTWLYSPSVKGSEYCFFVALLHGASLHVRKIMDHFDDQFITWMASNKITVYHSVASYFRYVAGSLSASQVSLDDLRLVILGGERVLKSDLDLFFTNFKKTCRLFTGLGATETGTICHLPFEELAKVEQSVAPIGYPVKGITLELLNNEGDVVTSGTGILTVKSKYISPGYWNENSERFSINSSTGEITYTSGDLAEIDANGVLHHRGRSDAAVKINGYLVNLLEVESAIMKYSGIQEAIVIAYDVEFQTRLHAFVQTNQPSFDLNLLRNHLSNNLAKQMVPFHYTLIDSWPRLPNGKINKKELISLATTAPENSSVSSTSEHEEKILLIWKKVLSVNDIPTNKPFNEVGGDSVAMLRLALEFKRAGITTVNLTDLVKNNTIKKQADLINSQTNK